VKDKEFFLRTESIKQDEILNLLVTNSHDESILSALSSPEPCLLEGSRGTGKSFLMKVSELYIGSQTELLAVFVSFNISSLLQTDDSLQFYHWMLAKALKALVNKLIKKGYLVSSYSANLLSKDLNTDSETIEKSLSKIVKDFEDSYRSGENRISISNLPDIEDVKEAIENICQENNLARVYFFFDEAAHVFRPDQQRQFFNLFKDLRSPYITCNAAIYPGVTYFGASFEPTHDCIYKRIERDIRDPDYLNYFRQIVFKQANDGLKKSIDENGQLFNTLALSCGGNPRILLRIIQGLEKFNSRSIDEAIKEFYRHQIWVEHTELGEKYRGHQHLIDWGRDFIEKYCIPAIEKYNEIRREKNEKNSTIYFWVHKDCPETVKESLRLLSYTSVLRKVESAVRASRSELGSRYEIKYGCILGLSRNPSKDSINIYGSLNTKHFPEFGKNHDAYRDIKDLASTIDNADAFKSALEDMLQKSIDVLQMLTPWQKDKLKQAGITTIEQLHQNTEDNLIEKIYQVGPTRARTMKNAATAELLEYLSG
jgi:hypothetical protein